MGADAGLGDWFGVKAGDIELVAEEEESQYVGNRMRQSVVVQFVSLYLSGHFLPLLLIW